MESHSWIGAMSSDDVIAFIGALVAVAGVSNAIVWNWLKRRQEQLIDRKTVIETESIQVDIAKKVLELVQKEHAEDKVEWAEERGMLRESNTQLRRRVERLEKQHDLDIVSAASHRQWDDQAHALAMELDSDFPPPPPIFHGEPKITIDTEFDTQMVFDLEGRSDESDGTHSGSFTKDS